MEPGVDPFRPVLDRLARYRHGVHRLAGPAGDEVLARTERRLARSLPMAWRAFAARWNGGELFRGALRLRSADELAPADEAWPELVVFAEGPGDRRWAWAPHGPDGTVYGELTASGLRPLHDRFDRWLRATVRILDEEAAPEQEGAVRLAEDPEGAWLLLQEAEALLGRGDPDAAARLLERATTFDPGLIPAWQRLGEIQLGRDRSDARFALLRALRATRLPQPWPGARHVEPELVARLGTLFPPGDPAWRQELERVLAEGVVDVRTDQDLRLYEQLVLELAHAWLVVRERARAAEALRAGLERTGGFQHAGPAGRLALERARLLVDLGRHDEAEEVLVPLRHGRDPGWRARALLQTGRIAVQRREPWAEDILEEALEGLATERERCEAFLLLAERALQSDDPGAAGDWLERADAAAVASGAADLRAWVGLVAGDLARVRGADDDARAAWARAEALALEAGDGETAARARLRLAEVAGEREGAAAATEAAVAAFEALELPLRAAWARLRLAALTGRRDALEVARAGFEAAELPAGVAAVDAMERVPGRSLAWHLERASEHERVREEAVRGRLAGGREAAERPERRLGAHRGALLHGGGAVVDRLVEELQLRARHLRGGPGRGLGTAGLLASADLLAGFRSAEAARALVTLLVDEDLPPRAVGGLQGVLARSPNPVVPQVLLESLDGAIPAVRLARVVEVLGWRQEAAAYERLVDLLERTSHPRLRRAALVALGRIGDRRAVPHLVDLLDQRSLDDALAVALLLLGDRRGVDFHAQALAQGIELDRSPGEIVGRYGGPDYLLLLLRVAEGAGPRAAGALQGLGYLGDPRAVPVMIEALARPEGGLAEVAAGALELMLAHRERTDIPGARARWSAWWEEQGGRFPEGVRHRYGQVVSVNLLVGLLEHRSVAVRRGAYDELAISTGAGLPFDVDGPWRVQRRHLAAWRRWARGRDEALPPGRWWFDGRIIG